MKLTTRAVKAVVFLGALTLAGQGHALASDGPKASVSNQAGTAITAAARGESIPSKTAGTAKVTPATITVSPVSRSSSPDKLTFQNIQVRPATESVLATEHSAAKGTSQFSHLTQSSGTSGGLKGAGGVTPNILLADPLGDWDGDGRSNLIEFAVGTDPNNPTDNADGLQVWIMDISGSKYLALGFRQRTAAGLPLTYQPEVSGDKQTWFSDASHISAVSTTSVDANFNWVTVRDTVPLTPATPRFVRLTVLEN